MKLLLLSISLLTAFAQAMEHTKVKIPSREIIKQKIEMFRLDEFFSKRELKPIYDLADQEKTPDEVKTMITSMIKDHYIDLKPIEDTYLDQIIKGKKLDAIHRYTFIQILLENHLSTKSIDHH
jgi:hypothetical protein